MAEKISFPPIKNGMYREAAIDQALIPQDSLAFSMNMHNDVIGAMTLRKGMTALGTQLTASTPILGMHFYRNNAGSTFASIAKIGTTVKAYSGSSWANIRTGITAGSKARFTNLVDYTFMVNGTGNEVLQTWSGSGSMGTTNDGDLPKGDCIENYRNRIWVAQATLDKVFYTDVVNTDNTISGGTGFLQISPNDGEKIRGLKRHPRALLVFKENHIYRIFNVNNADPDPSIMRGTYSQESIIESKRGIHYHHPSGFYDFVFDGEQKEISRPIIDIIQSITRANYDNIAGWAEDDALCWSVGDITLGGIAFTNVVCRYTLSTEVWTVYSTASEIRSASFYDDGSNGVFNLVGDDNGYVMKWGVGTTDNGSPIFYDLQTQWMTLTQLRTTSKTLSTIVSLHENAQGGNLSYKLDTDPLSKWRPIGDLARDLYQIDSLNAKDFYRIKFRLSGNSSGSPFNFRGFEALDLVIGSEVRK